MIVYLESLGCARNQVDSEIMLGSLSGAGHEITDNPSLAQVIIVNTCGFISSAADEAVDVILEMAAYKQRARCSRLIVTGCLPQRYRDDKDLVAALPEVDVFLGTSACNDILDALDPALLLPFVKFSDPNLRPFQALDSERRLLSEHYAYVKVSEGCNRKCTYCIIPELRGAQRSRPVDDIVAEAGRLVKTGIKEIILTAENTTDWGQDFKNPEGFEEVLSALTGNLPDSVWLRYLYTHPGSLSPSIIRTTAGHPQICSYYDVPVQHASDTILKKMGRPYSEKNLYDLFACIRKMDPHAALRTTLITGFPGETRQDFESLVRFIKAIRFDQLGVFTYSDSEDLFSHHLKNHVPEDVARKRHDVLMSLQAEISLGINGDLVGQTVDVLVEENPESGLYIGRTRFQAPEVDGVTFIYDPGLEIGSVIKVKITDGYEYDISGEPV